ncbi:MAG TPA: glucokinase [Myxococcota bacterium]|nr:glucokinase [Myxococcota bacterium]
MILAGDLGGTKTLLGLFEPVPGGVRSVREQEFRSRDHVAFEAILDSFLPRDGARPKLEAACFGVPGAVVDGRSHATNLPWTLEERALSRATGTPVKLLNDLQAMAYGMLFLAPAQLRVLQTGTRPRLRGNVAVIAAGTGLGEAMLYFDGEQHHPVASEGGHADFAPQSDEEIELLRWLRAKWKGHVSYERILAGPGLTNVYQFLKETTGYSEPEFVTQKLAQGDPNAGITELALAGRDPLSENALALFSRIYGAEAGNLAMRWLATGGVFVGGGIAPKILPILERGEFLARFNDKGRFTPLMQSLELSVSLEPRTALLGAAHYAERL